MIDVFDRHLYGLVEGDRKYVFDGRLEPLALFAADTDPGERNDLSRPAVRAPSIAAAHVQLASWLYAQDDYLPRIAREP